MAEDPVIFHLTSDIGFSFSTSVLPEGWTFGKSANWTPTTIISRSSPIYTYAHGNAITLSVMLDLHALDGNPQKDIKGFTRSLMALDFSQNPGIESPPLCHITLGNILDNWDCVLGSSRITAGNHLLYHTDGTPRSATAALDFIGIELKNGRVDDWLESGEYRYLSFNSGGGLA